MCISLSLADDDQLLVSKEEVPTEQEDWSSSLDQKDPELPHIKEEQEGKQIQELQEADTKVTITLVPVKGEDDEEKPQSSQLHLRQTEQMKTEAARNSDPDRHLVFQ